MAHREPALVTPFWVRIATETSLSPGWLLIALPAVLYPTYLLLEVLFGRGLAAAVDFGGDSGAVIPLRVTVALGTVCMVSIYLVRGVLRDLQALRPALREEATSYEDLRAQFTQFERHRLWIGILAGIVVALVLQETVAGIWTRLAAGDWSPRDFFTAVILFSLWIAAGTGAVYTIDCARLYSRIGERQVVVDLLDLSPLSPLTRHGLRVVLCVTVGTAVVAILVVADILSPPRPVIVLFTCCVWGAVVATAAFLLPVRGLRRQIRARKAEKLAQLRSDIRRNEELMAGSGTEAADAGAKLPGLMVMEKRIESVREWPFDAPTLTRFFLYVAIPLGSWVGGALVERLLGAALD